MFKETIKMLTIVKRKQFRRTIVFIKDKSILFDKQPFFDFKSELIIAIGHAGKLLTR